MSPIFVRPVREQAEHDRLIRHLQAKYKRKFEVAINLGEEQLAPIKVGTAAFFPDLVLTDGKKLAGVVEVESGESVNNLEAMAQWANFSRARVPFHLYVPVQAYEAARRLCDANHARPSEVWTYRPGAEGFDLVRMFADAAAATSRAPKPVAEVAGRVEGKPAPKAAVANAAPKPAPKAAVKPAAKPTVKPATKPAAKAGTKPAKAVKKPAARAKPAAPARKSPVKAKSKGSKKR